MKNCNRMVPVINLINNPMISHTNPPTVPAGEFLAATWSRVIAQQ